MTADEALASLIAVLESIERLVPADKASWDDDHVVRLAVERLWITAGNTSEEYRRATGVEAGVEPWGNWRHTEIAWLTPYRAICQAIASGPTRQRIQLASSRRSVSS